MLWYLSVNAAYGLSPAEKSLVEPGLEQQSHGECGSPALVDTARKLSEKDETIYLCISSM